MATPCHVLCTGGAGYIGSHTVIHLIRAGYKVTILDNLSNASEKIIGRLESICGQKIAFVKMDILDKEGLTKLFNDQKFDAVIHYAALKAVGESVTQPLRYYRNNFIGALTLFEVMAATGCKSIVFSSSATVYKPKEEPISETDAIGASNPYGHSKVFMEQVLQDIFTADPTWKISILRYFNPVGAHPSGTIGESPDQPMNLLPFIQQVAVGRKPALNVFGNDWPTRDGTGVRDYLHVEDLAEGHIAALKKLNETASGACLIHNLGTGNGVSVLEMVDYFEKASDKKIPVVIAPRRPGDLSTVVACVDKAEKDLGWKTKRTIEEGCASAWKWQSANPFGFNDK